MPLINSKVSAARIRASSRTAMSGWIPGFMLLSVIWGSSFLLIKIAVEAEVAPLWVALARCFFGAVTLWGVCVVLRISLPRSRSLWAHAAVAGLFLNAAPFTLFAIGEKYVSSVLAGIWNATTPLATLVFALLLVPEERPTARRFCGLLIGFVGVMSVLGVWRGIGSGMLIGSLACLGATTCYGIGFTYTRRFLSGRPESAFALTAMQQSAATVQLLVLVIFTGTIPVWPGASAFGALVLLGSIGTGVAFLLNLRVIRAAGPTLASTVTYVVPVWSTVLGAVLLAEPVGWNTVLGGILVVAGVVLTKTPPRDKVQAPELSVARDSGPTSP